MKVFKFGGASVKDAEAIKNVAKILNSYKGEKLIVVVSAMDKTTNALERLMNAYFNKEKNVRDIFNEVKTFHHNILKDLFPNEKHPVYDEVNNTFVEIDWVIEEEPKRSYNFLYDQIVSIGEFVSSKILSAYLNEVGITNKWLDARDLIQTDNTYREAIVNWESSTENINKIIPSVFNAPENEVLVTQGFIGGTSENYTTTLGREGSDYTAAILAYCADAEEVVIWKDVPGVLNADPKWFEKTIKLDQLSYFDAIELSYYGATVIHPKTIKPLQNKNIPLKVRSFLSPAEQGTVIDKSESELSTPCFIFKVDQLLITISPKDFSFIVEENLSDIFGIFAKHKVKMNLMQNSALSFSVCIDNDKFKIPQLLEELQKHFKVRYNENLELVTIRHYDQSTIDRVTEKKFILLEQKSRTTAQIVMRNL